MRRTLWLAVGLVALAAVVLFPDALNAAPPSMTARDAVIDGMAWLKSAQNPSGSWGAPSGSEFRDTTVAVAALHQLNEHGTEYNAGVTFLQFIPTSNNDYLARQTTALAVAGRDVSTQLPSLLGSQNPVELDHTRPNFPEGGWGIASGYSTSTLDTALALEALNAAGKAGGLTVKDETIGPGAGAGADTFQFELPGDVTDLTVVITDLTGQIDFRIKQGSPPTLADPFFNITTAPINLTGIPVSPGTYFIRVDSSVSSIYSFEVTFVAGGFDTKDLLTALNYLASSQNADGGWGISVGSDSNIFLTAKVLQTLEGYSKFLDVQTHIDGGISWLLTQQNPDGGFGSSPSTIYATSLAYLVIAGRDRQSPEAQNALDYILANQQADGSWNSDPYSTALALQALALTKIQLVPLNLGWNLISFSVNNCYYATAAPPTVPLLAGVECISVSSIDEVFSSIAGKYEVVRSFDATGAHTFDPLLPLFSDLSYVASGYGYWIKMTEPATLRLVGDRADPNSTLVLHLNWNLVGFWGSTNCWYDSASPPSVVLPADVTNCTQLASIGEAFNSIDGLYDVIRSFDEAGAHTFDPVLPLFSDLHYVAPGYGVWIKMNGMASLGYPPPP